MVTGIIQRYSVVSTFGNLPVIGNILIKWVKYPLKLTPGQRVFEGGYHSARPASYPKISSKFAIGRLRPRSEKFSTLRKRNLVHYIL